MKTQIKKILNHAELSEKSLERYLSRKVAEHGGLCLKFSSMTEVGYPDRVCLMPGGHTIWVELKSADGATSLIQDYRHRQMRQREHIVRVCRTRREIDNLFLDFAE